MAFFETVQSGGTLPASIEIQSYGSSGGNIGIPAALFNAYKYVHLITNPSSYHVSVSYATTTYQFYVDQGPSTWTSSTNLTTSDVLTSSYNCQSDVIAISRNNGGLCIELHN